MRRDSNLKTGTATSRQWLRQRKCDIQTALPIIQMLPEITKLLPWGIWRSNHIPNCFWKLGLYWPSIPREWDVQETKIRRPLFKFLFSTTCQNKLYLPPSTFPPTMNKMRVVTFQIMSELHSMRVCPEIACNQSGNGRSVCTPLFRTISSACWRAHRDKH